MNKHAEKLSANEQSGARIGIIDAVSEALNARGHYTVDCHDADGNLIWSEKIQNLVTTVGKNNILDNHLSGANYTAAWYIGLISITGYAAVAAGDTMASHAGWKEDTNYSQTARPATSFSSASGGSKSLSAGVVFTISAPTTIKGCFLASDPTKNGTTGLLYSAGLFTGGDQPVVAGNTLTVSYTAQV